MPFTTNMSGASQVDNSIIDLMDQQFLIANADQGVMDQFVTWRRDIGAKSIEIPKYSQLALVTSALTEDEDVTSEAMSDSQILFTPAEYGKVVTTTKLANLQTGGKADIAAARLAGINAGRSQDKLAILAAEGSSNEEIKGQTSESSLTASDVMDTAFLNKLYNKLARSSTPALQDGMYVAVMHDDVIHDLRDSTGAGSWQDLTKYTGQVDPLRNEIGALYGFRIVRDNNITINADAGSTTVDSYHSIFMGMNALGKAVSQDVGGTLTGPFDKLARFVNIGWYGVFKYGIADQDALWLGTTASSVGANA